MQVVTDTCCREQLRAFEEMGCRLDEGHLFLKRARLSMLSERRMETGCVDIADLSEPSAGTQALCTLACCSYNKSYIHPIKQ